MSWSELLQSVFTSVHLAIYRLSETDSESIRQTRALEVSVDRLRGAMAKEGNEEQVAKLARDAYQRTKTLAQRVKNTPARASVNRLLDLLTPYINAPQLAA
jgi:hypothetical protein